ncbi:MAG: hypothetical protein RSB70_03810 [Clostridium sp.]
MKEIAKFKKVTLSYSVNKKEVAREALKEFYGSRIQVVFGPGLIILGLVLNIFLKSVSKTFGNLMIVLGAIYIVLPIIILLFNLRKVKNSEVKMTLNEDRLISFDDNNKYELYYGLLQDVQLDEKHIIIKPISVPGGKLKDILIPRYKITTDNEEEFFQVLKEKVKEKVSERAKIICDYSQSSENKMRTILKYSATKDEVFNLMKKEYYSNKKNIYYSIALVILGIIVFNTMKLMSLLFLILAGYYLFQPYLSFKKKNTSTSSINIQFDLCKDKRIGILSEGINKEIPLTLIKVVSDEEDYVKILIDIIGGGIYYIPKENISEGSIEEFVGKLNKVRKSGKRKRTL